MEGFADYESDEEEPKEGEEAEAPAFKPAWQAQESEDDEDEEEEEAEAAEAKQQEAGAEAVQEPQEKKRKVLPSAFDAFSSVKGASFLTPASQPENEDLEFKPREENDLELEAKAEAARALKDRETKAATAKPQLAAKPLTGGVGLLDAEAKKKKEETTRQKNNRKQKLGQAKFTVKDNRECPDIWRG